MTAEQLRAMDPYELLVLLEKQVSMGRSLTLAPPKWGANLVDDRQPGGPLCSIGDFDIYPRGEGPKTKGT